VRPHPGFPREFEKIAGLVGGQYRKNLGVLFFGHELLAASLLRLFECRQRRLATERFQQSGFGCPAERALHSDHRPALASLPVGVAVHPLVDVDRLQPVDGEVADAVIGGLEAGEAVQVLLIPGVRPLRLGAFLHSFVEPVKVLLKDGGNQGMIGTWWWGCLRLAGTLGHDFVVASVGCLLIGAEIDVLAVPPVFLRPIEGFGGVVMVHG